MSAARRLPVISSILAAGFAIAAGSNSSVRATVARFTGLSAPGGTWRAIAIILAILNIKNLPLVWHYRLFRALLYHLYIQPTELPPSALFLPLITATHTPMNETDYNFHKSNSTYFTDLDIARTQLVTAIMCKGIRGIGKYPEQKNSGWSFANTTRAARAINLPTKSYEGSPSKKEKSKTAFLQIGALAGSGNTESGINTPQRSSSPQRSGSPSASLTAPQSSQSLTEAEFMAEAQKPGNLLIALGGTSCAFHREIPPYTRFEMWTRVLSWDRKWIYVVCHFVEAGAFDPPRYILQPWKGVRSWMVRGAGGTNTLAVMSDAEKKTLFRKKIYASSISKYVVKKGRLTIPPELVLERSEMLPPRPPGVKSAFSTPQTTDSPKQETPESGSTLDVFEESLFPDSDGASGEEWTWEKCEKMRLKGLKLAQHFDALDGLRETFDGGEDGSMGVFTDLIGNI